SEHHCVAGLGPRMLAAALPIYQLPLSFFHVVSRVPAPALLRMTVESLTALNLRGGYAPRNRLQA
ncbi:MAG TPA: hypothetical protein VN754_10880, partial [Candidatus Binataceae bacterium]|nr:hypothetical protein [Candidatus Binataceae bacterium]